MHRFEDFFQKFSDETNVPNCANCLHLKKDKVNFITIVSSTAVFVIAFREANSLNFYRMLDSVAFYDSSLTPDLKVSICDLF